MRFLDWALGWAELQVTGACPEELLNRCAEEAVSFYAVESIDELTLRLRTAIGDAARVASLGEKCCCEVELLSLRGAPARAGGLKARLALLIGAALVMLAVGAASFFIWDIKIDGAPEGTETKIRYVLAECGVDIGSYRPGLEADMIRSRVLLRLPELKWIGLQVSGSSVTVQVRRAEKIPELFEPLEPAKVVAGASGIIERLGAERGMALLKDGDTVLAGETIIDGVVVSDFDGQMRIVHAKGSVLARTWYEISAIMPMSYEEKLPVGTAKREYTLIFGGKRINFYRSSRILEGECDIIEKEYNLGIEGSFSLPVSLLCWTVRSYEKVTVMHTEAELRSALTACLEAELQKHLAGEDTVTSSAISFAQSGDFAVATLRAECLQNIADEEELSPGEIEKALGKEESTE